MTKKLKIIIILILVAVIVATAIIITFFFIKKSNNGMRICALANFDVNKPVDYKNSRMHFYKNGVFSVSVIHNNDPIFIGIGSYKKSGKKYHITYDDVWIRVNDNIVRYSEDNPAIVQIYNFEQTYLITGNGRVEFICNNGVYYYFK